MCRAALQPNAENCSQDDLNAAIKAAVSKRSIQRLQAIKALLMGIANAMVCELFQVTQQTLLIWVKAFNMQGIDALIDKPIPGRPHAIAPEQTEQLCDLLLNPSKADLEHWTAKKFHGYLSETLQIEVGYRTVVRWLHEQDFRLKVPQPWPDRQDETLRQNWLEQLHGLLADADVDLWYMDEMGVNGDPRPRRRWARVGQKARVTHNGEHIRMNVSGMICPRTGEAFLLEFTHSDREVFQIFLDEANRTLEPQRKRQILICDNASWHKCKSLDWGRFEPLYLPPYSPDFNPIERLWLLIKAEWFTDFAAKDRDALVARLDLALRWAMERKNGNQRTCAIH
ncbi:MAG TPA: IS630 family transposase [Candidatus Sumerlaeota bacterium]|jgi:transposase|nr:IS630 family transposase [Candidatus Sumerlaeota bacterium]